MATPISGSNWMTALKKELYNRPLNEIYIPGSHDSATYALENSFAKGQDYDQKLNLLKVVGVGFIVTKIAKNWAMAQDRTIYQQLNDGIRYLDLRVVYRENKNDFYIAHGLYGPKFSDVLADIARFLGEQPREIIVIQIGDLNYMGEANEEMRNHQRLTMMIQRALNNKLIGKNEVNGPNVKVGHIWQLNKQVFLLYKNKKIADQVNEFWPKTFINDYWANKANPKELKNSLDKNMDKRTNDKNGNKFYVTQSQMTPSIDTMKEGLLPWGDRYRSLKDMAKDVIRYFPHWMDEWRSRNPNIIILDFVNEHTSKHIYLLNNN